MSALTMREEFKAWFALTYPKINREEAAQDCLFKMIAAQAWESSRAALEVQVPESDFAESWMDAIEAAGVKVKV